MGRPRPLPPRSGLFLRNAGARWDALPVEDPRSVGDEVHGLRPVEGGRVRSPATGVSVDVGARW